jgi:uncharacterized protein (DUF58 family)
MLPAEILKKIKRIQLKTNYLANEIFAGEYISAFRGRGMEFEEVREYQPGDEIRTIDWNVTARMGRPFVKVYREEREMNVMILVDMSATLDFGTRERFKRETAAEVAAVLAYAAVKSNDKIGLMMFTDRVEKYIPAKKGRGHVYRVIQEILTFQPTQRGTNIRVSLEYLMRVMHRHSICFLVSDFLDEGYERALSLAKARHDMVCIQLYDPSEKTLPALGYVYLEDPETGDSGWVQTGSRRFQEAFPKKTREILGGPKEIFQRVGVDAVQMDQTGDYIEPLLQFFRMREKRM